VHVQHEHDSAALAQARGLRRANRAVPIGRFNVLVAYRHDASPPHPKQRKEDDGEEADR
jgi:hypothetical protein